MIHKLDSVKNNFLLLLNFISKKDVNRVKVYFSEIIEDAWENKTTLQAIGQGFTSWAETHNMKGMCPNIYLPVYTPRSIHATQ
ncbi:hypothetical protein AKJ60_00215 [candidate division MSBL1 archaeon SCGC-AAA385M11]|nr:hypothetical protein AKJ60_00215 [candidate division MSBL1 archaeon SCGC-AAA385M11]